MSVERGLTAKMPDGVVLWPTAGIPTHAVGRPADRADPHARTGAASWARSAGSTPSAATRCVIQSCRGTFGSEGEFVPVRNEQADGRATLEWVAAQPWFDGRLVMWGGSYLGMTQWAVAQDAPDFLRGARASRSRRRTSATPVVYPGGAFALETALAWLHEIKHQELGWRAVLRAHLRGAQGGGQRRARSCPSGSATPPPSASRCPSTRSGSSTAPPATPGGSDVDFGRRLDKVPPASFIGGWYDLFLRAQVADYEALRRAGRTARLTIGPWTHASPGLFAETVRDGPRWFDSQLGERAGSEPAAAPVRALRHGLAHVAGVLHVAAGGEDRALVPRARAARWRRPPSRTAGGAARPDRYHYNPQRPDAGGRRSVAQHDHGGTQGPAPPRSPTRRPHLHQPRADRGPHGHRPADRHAATCARRSSTPTSSSGCAT